MIKNHTLGMKACLLALLALPSVFAVRCYDYISTNDNRNTMKSWVDCPYEAQFCFKSYIEQHDMNNEKTWLASRSCGTPNLCTAQCNVIRAAKRMQQHLATYPGPEGYGD
ncbi:hypothetical protein ANCCEY_13075 [Ancylostoma ceylanicum]|uniref:Uncharacterized protein n=1 Tax=Ancylostoma ceylanicum TaxID=53326 RepID=A0A0D6L9P3_9BILA|nr:hypothetical protein ANCCEY_13075 [Ancylostoma ceylanicum]